MREGTLVKTNLADDPSRAGALLASGPSLAKVGLHPAVVSIALNTHGV
jgi:hypothetical protein